MFEENVEYGGSKMTSTLSGNISIDHTKGELVVREDGVVLTRVNSNGFVYSERDGTRRILIGKHPKNDEVGEWISIIGNDVIEELNNEVEENSR